MKHFILVLAAAATSFLFGAAAAVLMHKLLDLTLVATWIINTALLTGIVECVWYVRARFSPDGDDHRTESPVSPLSHKQ